MMNAEFVRKSGQGPKCRTAVDSMNCLKRDIMTLFGGNDVIFFQEFVQMGP